MKTTRRWWSALKWPAVGVGSALAAAGVLRAAIANLGATPAERARGLPGDERVPVPAILSTQAVTIRASPAQIWPWLAQLGQGHLGFDFLESLLAGDLLAVDRVLPEQQHLRPGERIWLDPAAPDGFRVVGAEPGRALVLEQRERSTASTWAFFLDPAGPGVTRLLVRFRLTHPPTVSQWLVWRAIEPLHAVRRARMLRGIRKRAEEGGHSLGPSAPGLTAPWAPSGPPSG